MSRFIDPRLSGLKPYTPGEQPRVMELIKLNTNESPYETSKVSVEMAAAEAAKLRLYSDPECTDLTDYACRYFGIAKDEVLFTNGSDEALNYAALAFCSKGLAFADITYGFYPVICDLYGIDKKIIPLKDDLSLDVKDYFNAGRTIVIANPNAPTGTALGVEDIETVLKENPDDLLIVDEAYVDFGTKSCIGLIKKYDNLLVVQTMSKSRSLAGGRLGMAFGNKELIADLNKIKYSTNPYNVNRMTMAAGLGALEDDGYFEENRKRIIKTRDEVSNKLKAEGFELTDSKANFIFARHEKISGKELYKELKNRNILVRHFDLPRISDYIRVTIGTDGDMNTFTENVLEILREKK